MRFVLADTTEWEVDQLGEEIRFAIEVAPGVKISLFLSVEGARDLAHSILEKVTDA